MPSHAPPMCFVVIDKYEMRYFRIGLSKIPLNLTEFHCIFIKKQITL